MFLAYIDKYTYNIHVCTICWDTWGEFNNASARRALIDWYLSLFIMCKAWHQYNERPRALALLNSPLFQPIKVTDLADLMTDIIFLNIRQICRHMMSKQHWTNVGVISWCHIKVGMTLFEVCVPAGVRHLYWTQHTCINPYKPSVLFVGHRTN